MKKLLLILALIVPMIAFTGCGSDNDEPAPAHEDYLWLTSNIVGEWYCYEYYASGRFISNEYFKDNKLVFNTNGIADISGLPSGNGNEAYNIEEDYDRVYLIINGKKHHITSISKNSKEITLKEYIKIRKQN